MPAPNASDPSFDLVRLAHTLFEHGAVEKARATLDLALRTAGDEATALRLKALLLRRDGDVAEAARTYERLGEVDPAHPHAAFLGRLLAEVPPFPPPLAATDLPVPYVRLRGFLPAGRHAALLAAATQGEAHSSPSRVDGYDADTPRDQEDASTRVSRRLPNVETARDWFMPLVEATLPAVMEALGMPAFTPVRTEGKCTAYLHGHFFKPHADDRVHTTRRISYVYYFHRTPRPYTGGDLRLFDRCGPDFARYFPHRFTTVAPVDNSIVFFPSAAFHEVTPVVCPSGAFEDARFTLHGHVHARDERPSR